MPQKASTPWSTRTVAEGGTDSPVGDLVPVPDEIKPVVNTGFIATTGKFTGLPADDLQFTFQDPNQALAPGADLEFDVDMLNHDILILAVLDSGGNHINIDLIANNPTTLTGPYAPFADVGGNGSFVWSINKNTSDGQLKDILNDNDFATRTTWEFFKVFQLRGTLLRMVIHNNSGSDTGTISTAYLRLV